MAGIDFEQRGALGLATLDRPNAMNALTHEMALELEAQLARWVAEPSIAVIAIRGAGDKAFCAGGDIRALWEAGRPGGARGANNDAFYADEYRLNTAIRRCPKPYVALMDGVVMGGGVGVSIHAARRIAGDRTLFAMPETGIGLFPDVGGTWFLPRLPGETGMWLGLTGARLRTADVLAAGICDHYVASNRFDEVILALSEIGGAAPDPMAAVDRVIEAFARQPEGEAQLPAHRVMIDRCFAGDNAEAVLEALAGEPDDWADAQRTAILAKSPTCTRIAFRQIRAGAELSFEDCMRLEYRLARFCMRHPDFYEGVRATIIDRDTPPRWRPATLAEADEAFVAPAFAPLGEDELRL